MKKIFGARKTKISMTKRSTRYPINHRSPEDKDKESQLATPRGGAAAKAKGSSREDLLLF
jgi:hypothetical protein